LIDIISSLPVLLFNLCFTLIINRRIVTYVKRVPVAVLGTPYGELRALRMSDIATVLRIKYPFDSSTALTAG